MRRLDLAPGFAAALCLLRLLAEPRVFYAFVAAAAAHEAGHLIAIYLSGGRVLAVRLGVCDARISAAGLGYRQELFCALAGPGMSVLLCLARGRFLPPARPSAFFWGFLMPCRSIRSTAGGRCGRGFAYACRSDGRRQYPLR